MGEASSAASDGRRLRWAEHRSRRRADFVAAGVAAVDEFGPDASAEQIAAAAKVSRTVLYRYFRDRDDLREAIAEDVVGQVIGSVVPHLQLDPSHTPRDIVESTVGAIIGWFDEHPNLYYFLRSRRNGYALEAVESSLADQVAGVLKMFMMIFGVDAEEAEPGAYGIVGLVESTGSWWLARRTMTRERVSQLISDAVWTLIDGTARTLGLTIGYDDPLPLGGLTTSSQP
ncbi:MAG: TetR/AcrR family transcriptional regulator [Jatrophihabitantaceae bacterium]